MRFWSAEWAMSPTSSGMWPLLTTRAIRNTSCGISGICVFWVVLLEPPHGQDNLTTSCWAKHTRQLQGCQNMSVAWASGWQYEGRDPLFQGPPKNSFEYLSAIRRSV